MQIVKLFVASILMLALFSVDASARGRTGIKVGIGSTSFGVPETLVGQPIGSASSSTGAYIGSELAFIGYGLLSRRNSNYYFHLDFDLQLVENGYLLTTGFGGRYKVLPKLDIGAAVNVGILGIENDGTNNIGFGWDVSAKYNFTENHGIIIEYSGYPELTNEESLISIDATNIVVAYVYTFY